jgi:hypothetical protein
LRRILAKAQHIPGWVTCVVPAGLSGEVGLTVGGEDEGVAAYAFCVDGHDVYDGGGHVEGNFGEGGYLGGAIGAVLALAVVASNVDDVAVGGFGRV